MDPNSLEFLRLRAVQQRAGLSRSEIYRRIAAGTFPRPRKYAGSTMTFWLSTEIRAWQESQIS